MGGEPTPIDGFIAGSVCSFSGLEDNDRGDGGIDRNIASSFGQILIGEQDIQYLLGTPQELLFSPNTIVNGIYVTPGIIRNSEFGGDPADNPRGSCVSDHGTQ